MKKKQTAPTDLKGHTFITAGECEKVLPFGL
jgi:hypothetical protein